MLAASARGRALALTLALRHAVGAADSAPRTARVFTTVSAAQVGGLYGLERRMRLSRPVQGLAVRLVRRQLLILGAPHVFLRLRRMGGFLAPL